MSYVYLSEAIPDITDIEVNDVGVIQSADETLKTYSVKFLRTGLTADVDPSNLVKFDIHETGDRFDYKVCDRCFKRLDTGTLFEDNRIKKDNIITKRPSCRNCRKLKNGKSISVLERLKWARTKPELFSDFTCPICMKTTIVGITKVVLDHNHETGEVRGWLCESCNTGIGRFDDNPVIVHRAIEWLNNN